MIDAKQIPPEVVEAAAKAANALRPGWPDWDQVDERWKPMERDKARAAIVAALNAWSGMQHRIHIEQALILPLQQEPRDE